MAKKLRKGDTIGVVCPSTGLINEDLGDTKFEISSSEKFFKSLGYKVKYGKHIFSNTTGYGASAKEKAEDINNMYKDKKVKAIFSLCGGENSNSTFEYLDLDLIKKNDKILCGYSDATSYINYICAKTGNIGFIGPAFKTISPEKVDLNTTRDIDYCQRNLFNHIEDNNMSLSDDDEFISILNKKAVAQGKLIGGNLTLITLNADYLDFKDKILFIEELSYESPTDAVSGRLYKLKQLGVFNQIAGLWIGNYENDISLEKIVMDTIKDLKVKYPIIKSDNFGHGDRIMTIPIGVEAKIEDGKIYLTENYLED
jgi:muramoyltetrapeptide carboxypeptidase